MAGHKIAILLHDEFEMWHPPVWLMERLRTEYPPVEVAYSSSKRSTGRVCGRASATTVTSMEMPQVLITPYTAFLTTNVWERHYTAFTGNLKR